MAKKSTSKGAAKKASKTSAGGFTQSVYVGGKIYDKGDEKAFLNSGAASDAVMSSLRERGIWEGGDEAPEPEEPEGE